MLVPTEDDADSEERRIEQLLRSVAEIGGAIEGKGLADGLDWPLYAQPDGD